MRIKIVMCDSMLRFNVAAQSWSIFQGCISNVHYYTTVYVQIWQPNSGLTLWIKEGTTKETSVLKKRRRTVRSGRTPNFTETKYAGRCKMGLTGSRTFSRRNLVAGHLVAEV